MIRRPPPAPRSVCVDVPDGHGVIEVIGDEGGSLLLLAGDPAVLEANDGRGSMGWLAARAGGGGPGLAEVKYLTEWLAAPGLVPDSRTGRAEPPDPECLRPLLSLLAPGRYVMTAGLAPHHLRVVHPARRVHGWYAEEELALVTTDAWPPRDHRAVRGYGERIRAGGALPALVVLFPTAGSSVGYLLDGHHKLAAYEREGVSPLVIRLAPQEPRPFGRRDLDRARAAFADGAPRPEGDVLGRVFASMRADSV
ncbi:hypothetical protein AB0N09_38985 [Streptomyces erythrochromogenes]|uniref:hypothetical protein n=1 Tax=Streptomyces erythrochromogenes TaxID=285574 RepID=UPI0034372924